MEQEAQNPTPVAQPVYISGKLNHSTVHHPDLILLSTLWHFADEEESVGMEIIEASTNQYNTSATRTACCVIAIIVGSKILRSPEFVTQWNNSELALCLDSSIVEAVTIFTTLSGLALTDKHGFLCVDQVIKSGYVGVKVSHAFYGYMQHRPSTALDCIRDSLSQQFTRITLQPGDLSVFTFMCSNYTFLLVFTRDKCCYADSHPKSKRGVLCASKALWARFCKPKDMAAHLVALFPPYGIWEMQKLVL